jgi:hypothetical protein
MNLKIFKEVGDELCCAENSIGRGGREGELSLEGRREQQQGRLLMKDGGGG